MHWPSGARGPSRNWSRCDSGAIPCQARCFRSPRPLSASDTWSGPRAGWRTCSGIVRIPRNCDFFWRQIPSRGSMGNAHWSTSIAGWNSALHCLWRPSIEAGSLGATDDSIPPPRHSKGRSRSIYDTLRVTSSVEGLTSARHVRQLSGSARPFARPDELRFDSGQERADHRAPADADPWRVPWLVQSSAAEWRRVELQPRRSWKGNKRAGFPNDANWIEVQLLSS